jgi:regulator of replication initiation timing
MKKTKLIPEMEQLVEENTTLKQQNKVLGELVDIYDKELNETSNILKQTANKLNEVTTRYEKALNMFENGGANNDQIDSI